MTQLTTVSMTLQLRLLPTEIHWKIHFSTWFSENEMLRQTSIAKSTWYTSKQIHFRKTAPGQPTTNNSRAHPARHKEMEHHSSTKQDYTYQDSGMTVQRQPGARTSEAGNIPQVDTHTRANHNTRHPTCNKATRHNQTCNRNDLLFWTLHHKGNC